jgi:hypothetical protein
MCEIHAIGCQLDMKPVVKAHRMPSIVSPPGTTGFFVMYSKSSKLRNDARNAGAYATRIRQPRNRAGSAATASRCMRTLSIGYRRYHWPLAWPRSHERVSLTVWWAALSGVPCRCSPFLLAAAASTSLGKPRTQPTAAERADLRLRMAHLLPMGPDRDRDRDPTRDRNHSLPQCPRYAVRRARHARRVFPPDSDRSHSRQQARRVPSTSKRVSSSPIPLLDLARAPVRARSIRTIRRAARRDRSYRKSVRAVALDLRTSPTSSTEQVARRSMPAPSRSSRTHRSSSSHSLQANARRRQCLFLRR